MTFWKEIYQGDSMKIIDVLTNSAELLGLKSERALLATATEENEEEILTNENIAKLFNLVKFSIQELCSNYVPVIDEKQITTVEKKYPVNSLTNFIRVQRIYRAGEPVLYKLINRNLVFKEDGVYNVHYSTYPTITSMFDDVDFLSNLSPDVMVFGLCAYYCLSSGMFEDFENFYEKYTERANSLKNLKFFELPKRRWE